MKCADTYSPSTTRRKKCSYWQHAKNMFTPKWCLMRLLISALGLGTTDFLSRLIHVILKLFERNYVIYVVFLLMWSIIGVTVRGWIEKNIKSLSTIYQNAYIFHIINTQWVSYLPNGCLLHFIALEIYRFSQILTKNSLLLRNRWYITRREVWCCLSHVMKFFRWFLFVFGDHLNAYRDRIPTQRNVINKILSISFQKSLCIASWKSVSYVYGQKIRQNIQCWFTIFVWLLSEIIQKPSKWRFIQPFRLFRYSSPGRKEGSPYSFDINFVKVFPAYTQCLHSSIEFEFHTRILLDRLLLFFHGK